MDKDKHWLVRQTKAACHKQEKNKVKNTKKKKGRVWVRQVEVIHDQNYVDQCCGFHSQNGEALTH